MRTSSMTTLAWILIIAGCDGGDPNGNFPRELDQPDAQAAHDAGVQPTLDASSAADAALDAAPDATWDAAVDAAEPAPVARLVHATVKLGNELIESQSEFSIKVLRELHIHTVWPDLTGEHRELRRIYAPDGSLYHQMLLPFSTLLTQPEPFNESPSVPHARVIQPAPVTAAGEAVVWDYLSVAGSWISEHGMTGTWRVEVTLDKQIEPAIVGTFVLNP